MSYSIGGRELPVIQGDTNQALQAIGQAYGAVNDSYDKLARLPGMAKTMVQDDADARYTAALNKYSNDPNGLAQALANGEIDTSNVRAETLGKTQDTLSNIQRTYGLNYVQGRTEADMNFMDKNGSKYTLAKKYADEGNLQGLADTLAGLDKDAPWESVYKFSQLSAQPEYDAKENRKLTAAGLNLQAQTYKDAIDSNGAAFALIQLMNPYADADPNERQSISNQIVSGQFIDGNGKVINTMPFWNTLKKNPTMFKAVLEMFGIPNITKVSAVGSVKDDSTNNTLVRGAY